ncbi:MAG: bile acid:sodium symporter [Phycisphaerae bacterium]|nr:bile acid:sodium symporter [Phycisphaerae bacterium]
MLPHGIESVVEASRGPRLARFLLRNLLTLGIVVAAVAGLSTPETGLALHGLGAMPAIIFTVFVLSGVSLETGHFLREARNLRAPLYAILAVSGIFPVMGFAVGKLMAVGPNEFVGLMVVSSCPTTLASGIILSALAGGSVAIAILITVVCSMTAVLLMPIVLQIVLGVSGEIDLPVAQMMLRLAYLIILPTIVGQVLRRPLVHQVRRLKPVLSAFNVLLVVGMIFIAVSQGAETLGSNGLRLVLHVGAVAVVLHAIMLVVNYTAGRAMRLPGGALRSLTIVASQKTIPISVFVALEYFPAYRTAVVPCVLFHLLQILVDSLIANAWSRKPT